MASRGSMPRKVVRNVILPNTQSTNGLCQVSQLCLRTTKTEKPGGLFMLSQMCFHLWLTSFLNSKNHSQDGLSEGACNGCPYTYKWMGLGCSVPRTCLRNDSKSTDILVGPAGKCGLASVHGEFLCHSIPYFLYVMHSCFLCMHRSCFLCRFAFARLSYVVVRDAYMVLYSSSSAPREQHNAAYNSSRKATTPHGTSPFSSFICMTAIQALQVSIYSDAP
jgi:hypothetical protein